MDGDDLMEGCAIDGLLALMARLRDPEGGCAWDLAQDFESIAPHTIEEAYEVADAIVRGDRGALRDELGDLLFQVVFHSQMAAEKGWFNFQDVAGHVRKKMIHRHPHVFGDEQAASPDDVADRIWESRKEAERGDQESVLDGITQALPALMRAQKLQNRAARTGFEWADVTGVLDKLEEEIAEMRGALESGVRADMADELGDLFFVLVNYARMLGFDSETVMRHSNEKFERRFRGMEKFIKNQGKDMKSCSLIEMEEAWQLQKRR